MAKAWIIAAALAAAAGAAQAEELVLNGVVARVTITPENRSDMVVTVQPGRGLAAPRMRREGERIIVEGGQEVRGCNTRQGVTDVRLRGGGRVSMAEAPTITVRAPRSLSISTRGNGAVSGRIGPMQNLQLASGGCSNWTLGDVAGSLTLTQSGGSRADAGAAGSAQMSASGGGVINAGQVRTLDARASGGGVVRVAGVAGPMTANASGGGSVRIAGGRTGLLRATASGGGWVDYAGSAEGLEANASGGGRVEVGRVTGSVDRRRASGGGVVRVRN